MEHLRRAMGLSERRACDILGQARSTNRYQPKREAGGKGEDARRIQMLRRAMAEYPRYGYRRLSGVLQRQGVQLSAKAVYRLRNQLPARAGDRGGGGDDDGRPVDGRPR